MKTQLHRPRAENLFRAQLLAWFRTHQRDLPWRRSRDPYRIWVAEIMLQQTRIAAVMPYYQRFLARFPTVQSLARAHVKQKCSNSGQVSATTAARAICIAPRK